MAESSDVSAAPNPSGWTSLPFVLALLALAAAGAWLLDRQVREHAHSQLRAELLRVAENRAADLSSAAARLRRETLLLAAMPPVHGIVRAKAHGGRDPEDGSSLAQWLRRMEHIFAAYAASNPLAVQVRLIGIADVGRELVRIQREGQQVRIVPEAALQPKGDRGYVTNSLALPLGAVLADGPSLNRENGVVQVPHQPVLRFATPIRDADGATFGVLAVNIDAERWFRSALTGLPSGFAPYLTTADGDFVQHPDGGRAYAFDQGAPFRWNDEFLLRGPALQDDGAARVQEWERRVDGSALWAASAAVSLAPDLGRGRDLTLYLVATPELIAESLGSARRTVAAYALLLAAVAIAGSLLFRRHERRLSALKLDQRRLAAIVESSDDAIVGKSLDGTVTSWNRGAERLFGWRADEMVGQSILRVVPEPLQPEEANILAALAEGRVIEHLRTQRRHKDGRIVEIAATISPIRDDTGRVVGASKIARDITGEYAAAQRLATDHARLEGEVEVRTAALQRALTRAEQADRAKGQFVANMSHEIRTPLNAVLGMLALIQRGGPVEQLRDYAGKATTAARSLLRLIDDLLDFSRIESGRLEIESQAFATESLFHDLAVVMGEQRRSPEVELLFDLDPGLPPILQGDRLRLQQVLANLVSNALKFTDRGNVVLRVRCRESETPQLRVDFEVIDSGIGMSAEQLARVFRPFVQADAGTSRRFGGSGLGLVISRRLVEAMGGELQARSTAGEGSRFAFTLPFPWVERPTSELGVNGPLAGLGVLVVDDNPLCRDILGGMLEGLGARWESASSGQQALDRLLRPSAAARIDAVLLDFLMPDLDGLVVAARLAEQLGEQRPRIVLVTAHGNAFTNRLHAAGSVSWPWLAKPVTPGQLERAVLGRGEAAAAAGQIGRLAGLHILLAEDNALNREVAMALLEAEGAHVTCAEDGLQVLAAVDAAKTPFDAVLMDLQMPHLDGIAAARALRERGLARLPIIALTANAYAQDRQACLAAGMNDHLGKPFDVDQLCAVLRAQCGGKAQVNVAADPAPSSEGSAAPPLLEEEALLRRRYAGHDQTLDRALRSFPLEAERLLAQLREAADAADGESARVAAHTLKGVAATVGAAQLAAAAAVESLARSAHPQPEAWVTAAAALPALLQTTIEATTARQPQRKGAAATEAPAAPSVPSSVAERLALAEGLARLERGELDALDGLHRLCSRHAQDADWQAIAAALDALDLPALRRAVERIGGSAGLEIEGPG